MIKRAEEEGRAKGQVTRELIDQVEIFKFKARQV